MELTECNTMRDIVETKCLLCTQTLLALQLLTLVGNLTGLLLRIHHMEGVTSRRCPIQTQDDGWLCRHRLFYALVTLIEHGLDTSMTGTGNHHVANLQCTIADQHRGDIAAALVERRLDDGTRSFTVGVGLQVEHLGLQQHLLQQLLHTKAFLGRNLLTLVLTTPLFHQQIHLCKVFTYLVGVGTRLVYLVDGKHHRHVGCLCMGNGLLRGRHDAVVSRNDDDGNIGHLCSTGTHGSEGLVTRSIQESYLTSVLQFHVVGTDVLRDATCLTGNNVRVTDVVKQRRLTMIDMTHDGNDGGTTYQVVLVVFILLNGILHLGADILGGEAELVGHNIYRLGIQALVDTYHDADAHAGTDDLCDRHIHHRGQLRYGHELRQLEHLALCCLLGHLFVQSFLDGVALLTTILGTLLVLAFRGQTCQRLLYLACYCLFINLQRLGGTVLLVLLAAALLLIVGLLVTLVLLAGTLLLIVGLLFSSGFNIHTLLTATDTLALLALTLLLGSFLLTFLATFLLALLLGACALVDARQVYLTQHVDFRSHLGFALQRVNFGTTRFFLFVCLRGFFFRIKLFVGRFRGGDWCFHLLHFGFRFGNRL